MYLAVRVVGHQNVNGASLPLSDANDAPRGLLGGLGVGGDVNKHHVRKVFLQIDTGC